jgi:acyl-CoA synthetase (AMP-forming)/AMP-acid ligase II
VATGDIGFSHHGHLFVLGRRDDTLIVNGRNYFLSDIVAACAGIEGVRPGRIAAFLARDPGHHEAVVWLVAETSSTAQRHRQLRRQVQRQVLDRTELFVAQVALLPPGAMPVTTSGKVRVSQVRQQVEDGSLALLCAAGETADDPS